MVEKTEMGSKDITIEDPDSLLLRGSMINICKTGIVDWKDKGDKSVPVFKKGKHLGFCQWSHTIGQPIPRLNKQKEDG